MSAADNYRDTLITIVEKSATLAERLSGEFVPINDPAEAEIIETRLKTWIQTAAQGDPERFRKRLEWDGLRLEQVKPLLGSVRRRDPDAPLPRWAELLGEILHENLETPLYRKPRTLYVYERRLQFEEILEPFIRVADKHIRSLASEIFARGLISSTKPIGMLNYHLREALAGLSMQALTISFGTFQILKYGSELSNSAPELTEASARERFLAFALLMLSGELEEFLLEYSVLARLFGTKLVFWIDSIVEFLNHFVLDFDDLCKMLRVESILVKAIETIQPLLSDPHQHGRTIISTSLLLSDYVIYKPKSLYIEEAFNDLLDFCKKNESPISFSQPEIIHHKSYSWMKYIHPDHFFSDDQRKIYFHQAGLFLALIHALAANDCHSENVINDGKQPVLIDAETLIHHRVPDIEYHFPDARATAHAILENSVLRTQFLPKWELGGNGQLVDMSALGNESISPNDYETEIISGFTEMYRFLMAHREELLAEGSPLEGFKNQRVRYVFRPTQTYQTVLQHTLQPRYLHEGIDRSIQIESLNRVLLAWDEKPVYWDIHKGEAQAMEQMDVPLLTYNSSDTSLHIGDITIENVFDRPAYTLVIERLNSMSEDDLHQQIAFIRGSLFCRIAHELPDTDDEMPSVLQNAPTLPRELLMSEAGQNADELQARAIWGKDGSATWITLTYHFAANRYQFGQISDGLYDGACGVAFYLAALHHVTGWSGARELALAAIKPLQNRLYHPVLSQRLARNLGVNGPSGLKSILFSLRHISELLDEPNLLGDVRQVESLISPERDMAEQKAGRIPENVFAQAAGRWRIAAHLPKGVQLWGLYGGRVGVGYELLKLLDTNLPSIPF